jgi:hypothetical protein
VKALDDRTHDPHQQSAAEDLAMRIAAIFEYYPLLCGFAVHERSAAAKHGATVPLVGGLYLADVSVFAPKGLRPTPEFGKQIAQLLVEVIDEHPGISELLSGRTFARILH